MYIFSCQLLGYAAEKTSQMAQKSIALPQYQMLSWGWENKYSKYMEMDYGVQFSLKRNKILQLVVCLSILVEQCCNVSCVILFDSLALT